MRPRLIILSVLAVGLAPALALASPAATKKYKADLSGSSIFPKEGPASAKGSAQFTVTGPRLCWRIRVSGIDTPVAVHIHTGGPFTNGPVVVALGKHYKPAGCTTISTETAVTIAGCGCGKVYMDVHTKKHPQGAIRGILELSRA